MAFLNKLQIILLIWTMVGGNWTQSDRNEPTTICTLLSELSIWTWKGSQYVSGGLELTGPNWQDHFNINSFLKIHIMKERDIHTVYLVSSTLILIHLKFFYYSDNFCFGALATSMASHNLENLGLNVCFNQHKLYICEKFEETLYIICVVIRANMWYPDIRHSLVHDHIMGSDKFYSG